MKLLYQNAIEVTAAVVNEWDPYSLISGGAPKDEFTSEVSRIVAKAHEVNTPEALARVISEVFSVSFEPVPFSVEACLPVATRLFQELKVSGFVGSKP
jgi:hypothetical protein